MAYPETGVNEVRNVYVSDQTTQLATGNQWGLAATINPNDGGYMGLSADYGDVPYHYLKKVARSARKKGDHVKPTSYIHNTLYDKGVRKQIWERRHPKPRYQGRSELTMVQTMRSGSFLPAVKPLDHDAIDFDALDGLARSKFELGVFLVEARETASYIADKATKVFRTLVNVKKGNIKALKRDYPMIKPKTALDTVSSRWLEYQMAVKPTINDMNAAIELFKTGLERNAMYIVSKSTAVAVESEHGLPMPYYGTLSYDSKLIQGTKLYAKIIDHELDLLKQIGLDNVPYALWNGVPFSFAVDYTLPVGDWLRLMSLTKGLEFEAGYRFKRWICSGTATRHGLERELSYDRFVENFYEHEFDANYYERTLLTAFPQPKVLKFKNPFVSTQRVGNIAALTYQLLK